MRTIIMNKFIKAYDMDAIADWKVSLLNNMNVLPPKLQKSLKRYLNNSGTDQVLADWLVRHYDSITFDLLNQCIGHGYPNATSLSEVSSTYRITTATLKRKLALLMYDLYTYMMIHVEH